MELMTAILECDSCSLRQSFQTHGTVGVIDNVRHCRNRVDVERLLFFALIEHLCKGSVVHLHGKPFGVEGVMNKICHSCHGVETASGNAQIPGQFNEPRNAEAPPSRTIVVNEAASPRDVLVSLEPIDDLSNAQMNKFLKPEDHPLR